MCASLLLLSCGDDANPVVTSDASTSTESSESGVSLTSSTDGSSSSSSTTSTSEESTTEESSSSESSSTGEVAVCGDGIRQEGEVCDGTDFGPESCATQGFDDGDLGCTANCNTLIINGCFQYRCGNGTIQGKEECDGVNLGGASCLDLLFDGGTLQCGQDCLFDVRDCTGCGNDELEDGELCEGDDLDGQTCQGLGFTSGSLGCFADCTFDTAACGQCGNGFIDGNELCDQQDLGGVTCNALGLGNGTLACSGTCQYNAIGCEIQGFTNCAQILDVQPGAVSGIYQLDPDGPAVGNDPVDVYCDMETDGGGWTLVGSTRTTTFDDQALAYHSDLTTTTPLGPHPGIWDGLRPQLAGTTADVRFTCKQNPNAAVFTVDLSFYDVIWYDEFTTGTEADSCFSEGNGLGADVPPPARRNNITGVSLPQGDQWNAGYLEGEDVCNDNGDFTVDFDDRGMDSNQGDGTDWGEDDSSRKCGTDGLGDGAWHIWVRP